MYNLLEYIPELATHPAYLDLLISSEKVKSPSLSNAQTCHVSDHEQYIFVVRKQLVCGWWTGNNEFDHFGLMRIISN